jgi:very-short-patch-repair endonuclease
VFDGAWLVPDAYWPEASLIVEIDSIEWHRFGDAPERTERRRAQLAALGWTVVPVSPRWLREDPAAVQRTIERAYLSGTWRRAS